MHIHLSQYTIYITFTDKFNNIYHFIFLCHSVERNSRRNEDDISGMDLNASYHSGMNKAFSHRTFQNYTQHFHIVSLHKCIRIELVMIRNGITIVKIDKLSNTSSQYYLTVPVARPSS